MVSEQCKPATVNVLAAVFDGNNDGEQLSPCSSIVFLALVQRLGAKKDVTWELSEGVDLVKNPTYAVLAGIGVEAVGHLRQRRIENWRVAENLLSI